MVATPSTMVPLGSAAPSFTLAEPDGTTWTFDRAAGQRGTLVAFVCNHCPYVKLIAPHLGSLAAQWRRQGVGVIGINPNPGHPDETPELMTANATAWRWSFPYVLDAEQTAARDYHAACTPDFFLYDGAKRLVYRGRSTRPGPATGCR
jgi:thiol-disulfide isomerase/thioredoxin